ncbi:MAG: hypothetical protein IPK79_04190 [Vampirovibrionales bacterium]|nr:hypothetical protein [Vampirovibrionales bacterium]
MKPIAGPRFGGFSIEKPSDRIPYIQLPIAVRNLPVFATGQDCDVYDRLVKARLQAHRQEQSDSRVIEEINDRLDKELQRLAQKALEWLNTRHAKNS